MCFIPGLDPLTIGAAAVSAAGTMFSAAAQAASARAQSQFQQRQARLTQQQGAYEADRQGDVNDRKLAGIRSAYLKSGIALTGSATDVLADSATEASLDEQAIRFGAQIRSDNLMFESQMSKMNARNAMIGGGIGALGSIVNGFTQQREQNQMRTLIRNPYQF